MAKEDAKISIGIDVDSSKLNKNLSRVFKTVDGAEKKLFKTRYDYGKKYSDISKRNAKEIGQINKKMSNSLKGSSGNGFIKSLEGTGKAFKAVGASINMIMGAIKAGGVITAGIMGTIGAVGAKSLNSFASLEEAIASISTIADIDNKKFTNDIVKASDEINTSAVSLAEAVYELYSTPIPKNFPGADMINLAKEVAKFAKGSKADAADAMNLMTNVMAVYKIDPGNKAEVQGMMDTLFSTIDFGKISGKELSANLGDILTPGSLLGLDLKELTAGMASLTVAGINPAESATAYKNLIKEFSIADSELNQLLGEVTGKTFAQLKGEGNSIVDIIGIIATAAEKANLNLFSMTGEVRSGIALAITGGTMQKEFSKIYDSMNSDEIVGKTEKAFGKMQDTLRAKFDAIEVDVENFWTSVGSKVEEGASVKALFNDIDKDSQEVLDILSTGIADGLIEVFTVIKENKAEITTFISETLPLLFDALIVVAKELAPVIRDGLEWLANAEGLNETKDTVSGIVGFFKELVSIIGMVIEGLTAIDSIIKPVARVLMRATSVPLDLLTGTKSTFDSDNKYTGFENSKVNPMRNLWDSLGGMFSQKQPLVPSMGGSSNVNINVNNPRFNDKKDSQRIMNDMSNIFSSAGRYR